MGKLILYMLALCIAFVATSHGQTLPDQVPQLGTAPAFYQPLIDGLLGKYGWLVTVVTVIGTLRVVFKPIMLAVENFAKDKGADASAKVIAFEAGPIYKVIATVLDFGASIKIPPPKK